MPDPAYTAVYAWPWPGEDQLPQGARDALAAHDLAALLHARAADVQRARLLGVEDASGAILEIVDEEADAGREGYRDVISALRDAGLNVYAKK